MDEKEEKVINTENNVNNEKTEEKKDN